RSTANSLLDDVAWEEEVAQLDRVISEAERECPSCGATVPAEMALCPSCGMRLSIPKPAPAPKRAESSPTPELDALVDDLLVGELEESLSEDELEKTKAAVLDWLILELEESMAPETQIVHPAEKEKAEAPEEKLPPVPSPLAESIGFLSQWVRGSRGLVSGLRPKHGPRGSGRVNGVVNGQGRVNGLVNGVGRTNGLVNGMGRVNGLTTPTGRVNGLVTSRGRVNGLVTDQGRVNGIVTGVSVGRPTLRGLRLPYPSRRVRYFTIASGVLVAILIAGLLFVPPSGPSAPIVIDGSFLDWSSVPMFDAATTASDANVSIAHYASLLDHDSLYLFASTSGGMFADATGYDGVDFLIDADGNASTGFTFRGIGADAVIEVFGGNHTVAGARLYSFPVDSEVNWSRRQPGASVQAAASINGLEIKASTFDIDRFDPSRFRVSVYADDFLGSSSRSLASLSAANGAVLLDVRPLTTVIGTGVTPIFEIHARALGLLQSTTWQVSNFQFNQTPGVIRSLSAESINLTQGRLEDTISVLVSAPGFFQGNVVEVSLIGAASSVPVFVHGAAVRAYVTSPPSQVQIDGLFSDWISRDVPDTDPTRVKDPDLDIVRYGAATSNGSAFFHVHVAGIMFGGGIPDHMFKSPAYAGNGTSGGGATILPRRTGEDILLAFVESNSSNSRGFPIGGLLADYLVEIRGEGGQITSRSVYSWQNRWIHQPGVSVSAAKDATDIEVSLPVSNLSGTQIVIQSTDWTSAGDTTIPLTAPSFSSRSDLLMKPLSIPAPVPLTFGNLTFYLRDTDPGLTSSDCSAIKGLSTLQGSSGTTIALDTGVKACYFTDPETSSETITVGSWSASLDLSAVGTELAVTFAVTSQDGSSPSLVCGETKLTAALEETFSCNPGAVLILLNQRIRLLIEYISGTVVDLGYNGNAATNDSSMSVPIPEFGDPGTLVVSVSVLVLVLSIRRRRRTW
ncbi:MAG: zinc ribbon domain-containing protein, partial [Methanobacteriota archaeon]